MGCLPRAAAIRNGEQEINLSKEEGNFFRILGVLLSFGGWRRGAGDCPKSFL